MTLAHENAWQCWHKWTFMWQDDAKSEINNAESMKLGHQIVNDM